MPVVTVLALGCGVNFEAATVSQPGTPLIEPARYVFII